MQLEQKSDDFITFNKSNLIKDIEYIFDKLNEIILNYGYHLILFLGNDTFTNTNCKSRIIDKIKSSNKENFKYENNSNRNLVILHFYETKYNSIHINEDYIKVTIGHNLPAYPTSFYFGNFIHLIDKKIYPNIINNNISVIKNNYDIFEFDF